MDRQIVGKFGETEAIRYLKKHKYDIIETNFHTKFGEIDIIAKNCEYIIFVEVKTRMKGSLFEPKLAVTRAKQNKIKTTAALYLSNMTEDTQLQPRFDVIEIITENKDEVLSISEIEHMENAFWS